MTHHWGNFVVNNIFKMTIGHHNLTFQILHNPTKRVIFRKVIRTCTLHTNYVSIRMEVHFHPLCVAVTTLRSRQNGRRFAYDTFKCIFWNENVKTSTKLTLKFVSEGPALVKIMAWRLPGDKPSSEPTMIISRTRASPRLNELKRAIKADPGAE